MNFLYVPLHFKSLLSQNFRNFKSTHYSNYMLYKINGYKLRKLDRIFIALQLHKKQYNFYFITVESL